MNSRDDTDPDRSVLLDPFFRALVERVPQLVWVARDGGDWAWASPSWTAMTGQTSDASQGHGWELAVHPDDRKRTELAWALADATGILDVEHRLLDPKRPSDIRWFHTRATPLPELAGRAREWLGCCTDIHDRKLLQESVQNRIDQLLALIHTVVRRGAAEDITAEAYSGRIETRLNAIARTQAMLNRPGDHVDLAVLISEALLAHATHEGDRVSMEGPRILLRRGTVEILGLAMHELASNAVEHGAMSKAGGSVAIRWQVEGDLLRFEWNETLQTDLEGVPPRTGLGKDLIETVLKLQLGAAASFDVLSTGIRCVIAIPLDPHLTLPDQADPGVI